MVKAVEVGQPPCLWARQDPRCGTRSLADRRAVLCEAGVLAQDGVGGGQLRLCVLAGAEPA